MTEKTTAPTEDDVALDIEDPFERQLVSVVLLHRERNAQYLTSPLEILPVEDWLAQVAIKGVRARQAIQTSKVVDELNDVIVYAAMTLEQIEKQKWSRGVE